LGIVRTEMKASTVFLDDMKIMGRTDPWGTPQVRGRQDEVRSAKKTTIERPARSDLNRNKAVPVMPI